MPSGASKRTEYAQAHRDFMATLGMDDEFMVTTRSPKVPVARVLKEANRRYRHEHQERVSAAHVQNDDGVHHAHELFQKRPGKLLDLLRFRLTGGGSVMATFHPGMIRYMAKNLEHESAQIEYDAGLSKSLTPTVPATEPGKMEFGDSGACEVVPASKQKSAVSARASAQAGEPPGAGDSLEDTDAATREREKRRSGRVLDYDSGLYRLLKIQGRVEDVMLMLHIQGVTDPEAIDALQLSAFSTYKEKHPESLDITTVQSEWYGKTTRFILFGSDPVAIEDLIEPWLRLGGSASLLCQRGRLFQMARLNVRDGATPRRSLDARLSGVRRKRLSWERRTRTQDEAVQK